MRSARDAVAELRQSASPEDVRLVQEAAEWLRRYDAVVGVAAVPTACQVD